MSQLPALSAFSTDRTPKVTVEIDGQEYGLIEKYCYQSDLLQLGDPFSVALPDPLGQYRFHAGDPIKLYMADPDVAGGKKVQKVTGVVTQVVSSVDPDNGTVVNVAAADLGYHLVTSDVPIWQRLEGMTFGRLYDVIVDKSWGFAGFKTQNDDNTRLKFGGNYARTIAQAQAGDKPPVIQTEPGDKPADLFITYAKLASRLVNVSSDGFLQLFAPRYDTPVAYHFYNYRDPRQAAGVNNVESATLTDSLDSRWNKAVCVGTRLIPVVPNTTDPNDPNVNSFRGTYTRPVGVLSPNVALPPLSFNRMVAFADADRLSSNQAAARARWKIQRGEFDAWMYEITVKGHSQGGGFYEPDTLCEVQDTFFGISGTYYVSKVVYNRDENTGTTTTLQIRLPHCLAA